MYRVWNFIANYSVLLIGGALIALVWANIDPVGYRHFVEFPLWFNGWIGEEIHRWDMAFGPGAELYETGDVERVLTIHYLVNDLLMALFFFIAGKEVWEAVVLKRGALRGRKAATPLVATAGGMIGPVVVYLGLAAILGSDTYDAVANGWAIPTATDIAFSYVVGRMVFGAGHPAVRFLLLLAIADDAGGLIILALFYPSAAIAPVWLLLSFAAAFGAFVAFNWLPRRLDRGDQNRPRSTWVRLHLSWYPYAVAGLVSLFAFTQSGLHPALALLPLIPALPHADRAFGIFAEAETHLHDVLNEAEHALQVPVEVILFLFGLVNAGVVVTAIGAPTWLVLGGLLLGKPVGIALAGLLAARVFGLGLPDGMRTADLVVVGLVAAIGFTVSLFFAAVAFDPGPVQEAAKMGALFSFVAVIAALVAGKLLRVEKRAV
ncbi:Na+/H+ antiporter NhaA [Maritimibacter sp. UBA3975]|uniref:Na+/H+ antiporter NhaA n=1 Tax=Maritimibacter sp. UBA3975 TaxID=1946833 RepID=UPI000C09A685|nr:Na+/H+ antiporter NhaA [Maritimibacter sp. UBA3975]MAM62534.1 sodium:proton antiporter [Maritimibacter sp.]